MHLLMNWPGLYWKRKCFLMHCSCNYILSMCEDVNQGLTTRCLRICFQLHLQKGLKTLKSSVFFLNLNDYIMIALHYIDRISPKSKMENNLVKVTPVVCLHTAVVFLLVEIKWDGEKKKTKKKTQSHFPSCRFSLSTWATALSQPTNGSSKTVAVVFQPHWHNLGRCPAPRSAVTKRHIISLLVSVSSCQYERERRSLSTANVQEAAESLELLTMTVWDSERKYFDRTFERGMWPSLSCCRRLMGIALCKSHTHWYCQVYSGGQ